MQDDSVRFHLQTLTSSGKWVPLGKLCVLISLFCECLTKVPSEMPWNCCCGNELFLCDGEEEMELPHVPVIVFFRFQERKRRP